MTKQEVYKTAVRMYEKTGQGISEIFFHNNRQFLDIMDELIKDGLIKKVCIRYNHLPNDYWFCLTDRYCVEEDENKSALAFVRHYMGVESDSKMQSIVRQASWFEEEYQKWLSLHKEELEKSFGKHDLPEIDNNFSISDEALKFLKSRDSYKDNKKVSECSRYNNESLSICNQMEGLMEQRLRLSKREEHKKELEEVQNEIKLREEISKYLRTMDQNELIKNVVK